MVKVDFSVRLPIKCGIYIYKVHLTARFSTCVGLHYSSFFG